MSVELRCDACGVVINRETAYYQVDVEVPTEDVDEDADEFVVPQLEVKFGAESEYHACSASCLASWALERSVHPSDVGGS